MKINYIFAALAAFMPLAAAGQNLDPTVEVTRAYEGKLMEVHKPQLKMEVPDSVRHFDLDFDYTVTDKPYMGAYEFRPYSMDMRPTPTVRDDKSFRLKAGLGYQLHPVVDMLWTPKLRTNAFTMDVYASHNSFYGNYWIMDRPALVDKTVVLDHMGKDVEGKRTWRGFDAVNKAGVNGRADWKKGLFKFAVGYDGLIQNSAQADMVKRFYNALDAEVSIASKKTSGFVYALGAGYNLSGDGLTMSRHMQAESEKLKVGAYDFEVDAFLGYARTQGDRFVLDFGANAAGLTGSEYYRGVDIDLIPHYVRSSERWFIDLGVRFSPAIVTSRFTDEYGNDGQLVYPDVRIEWLAVRDALKLYVDVSGDSEVNSYSDILASNRFVNPEYSRISWELMDASEEKLNALLGMEARIGSRFSFSLSGGYVKYADALMEGLYMTAPLTSSDNSARLLPAVGYGSYDKAYAALGWLLDTESVRFGGNVEYARSWVKNPEDVAGFFMPAALKGDVEFMYDWKERIFVGVDCEFTTARKGNLQCNTGEYEGLFYMKSIPSVVPGYADLGLNLEYRVNRKLSVWGRGGNLLGMTIQRHVLFAEKGPYFTVGVCLNL